MEKDLGCYVGKCCLYEIGKCINTKPYNMGL